MNNDTTIYGYVGDGVAFHPACWPEGSIAHAEGQAYALFSWDDDGEGLVCDGCGEYIFEPSADRDNGENDTWDGDDNTEPEDRYFAGPDNMIYPQAFWPVDHEEGE